MNKDELEELLKFEDHQLLDFVNGGDARAYIARQEIERRRAAKTAKHVKWGTMAGIAFGLVATVGIIYKMWNGL